MGLQPDFTALNVLANRKTIHKIPLTEHQPKSELLKQIESQAIAREVVEKLELGCNISYCYVFERRLVIGTAVLGNINLPQTRFLDECCYYTKN